MNTVLEDLVKMKIDKQKNINFQQFVNKLYSVHYETDFTVIKQKHDKGSDGLLKNSTVLACYAPDAYNLNDFKKKIKGDFESYQKNWQNTYNGWQVVYNGEFLSNMIKFVQSLYSTTEFIGIDNIVQLINSLNWTKQNQIYDYLGISTDYIVYDIVNEIVKDIIKLDIDNEDYLIDIHLTPIAEKIKLNYSEAEIEFAIYEMTDYLQYAAKIKDYFKENNDYFPILLNKIKVDYHKLNNQKIFSEKLKELHEIYVSSVKRNSDDVYKYYVKIMLLYMFENCYIGKKAK